MSESGLVCPFARQNGVGLVVTGSWSVRLQTSLSCHRTIVVVEGLAALNESTSGTSDFLNVGSVFDSCHISRI